MKPLGSSLLSALTSASLLMHVVLGCCWHHDHAQAAQDPLPSGVLVDPLAAGTTHAAAGDHAPCSGSDSERAACGQRCFFTRPSSVRVLAQPQWDSWRLATLVRFLSDERSRSPQGIAWALPNPHSLGALRLHLAYQVLLT